MREGRFTEWTEVSKWLCLKIGDPNSIQKPMVDLCWSFSHLFPIKTAIDWVYPIFTPPNRSPWWSLPHGGQASFHEFLNFWCPANYLDDAFLSSSQGGSVVHNWHILHYIIIHIYIYIIYIMICNIMYNIYSYQNKYINSNIYIYIYISFL